MKLYIREARETAGISQKDLAARIGVAPSTFNGYEMGNHDPKSELLIKIARECGVSVDFLLGVDRSSNEESAPSLTDEALDIAKRYDTATPVIKNVVKAVLAAGETGEEPESTLAEVIPTPRKKTKVVPLFNVAAGTGDPSPDVAWENYETENLKADFAIHIVGDSMEPLLPDGSIALGVKDMPRDGEVGAFRLDGEFLVKQVCQDIRGTTYLFATNRARSDADKKIERDSDRDLWCFGTILCEHVPLPGD